MQPDDPGQNQDRHGKSSRQPRTRQRGRADQQLHQPRVGHGWRQACPEASKRGWASWQRLAWLRCPSAGHRSSSSARSDSSASDIAEGETLAPDALYGGVGRTTHRPLKSPAPRPESFRPTGSPTRVMPMPAPERWRLRRTRGWPDLGTDAASGHPLPDATRRRIPHTSIPGRAGCRSVRRVTGQDGTRDILPEPDHCGHVVTAGQEGPPGRTPHGSLPADRRARADR